MDTIGSWLGGILLTGFCILLYGTCLMGVVGFVVGTILLIVDWVVTAYRVCKRAAWFIYGFWCDIDIFFIKKNMTMSSNLKGGESTMSTMLLAQNGSLGIDLGTSRSGIAVADVEKPPFRVMALPVGRISASGAPSADVSDIGQVQNDRPSYRIPSVVACNKFTGARLVGEDVQLAGENAAFRTFASAKSDLSADMLYFNAVGSVFVKPSRVIAEILSALRGRASTLTGGAVLNRPVSIAVPASLPYEARREILAAAEKAGWQMAEGNLVEEPVAVLLDILYGPMNLANQLVGGRRRVAVYDIGAGTCDVAVFELESVCRNNGAHPDFRIKTLALGDYDRLGGDNFDIEIARKALLPQIIGDRRATAEDERLFVNRTRHVARQLKETLCDRIDSAIRQRNGSPSAVAPMDYPPLEVCGATLEVGGSDTSMPPKKVTFSTDMLLAALQPFLSLDPEEGETKDGRWIGSLLEPLDFALSRSGIDPGKDLDLLILSGASCRAPFVPFLLAEYLARIGAPRDNIQMADLDLSVERGAAIHAAVLRRAGIPLIEPVLGEDIGMWVYGDRPEPLVSAGTVLPYPPTGEKVFTESFFVPQDDLERVVVELYSRTRKIKKQFIRKSFDVPKGTHAGAPVVVTFRIDASKVIHLKAELASHRGVGVELRGEEAFICGRAMDEEAWVESSRQKVRRAIETTGVAPLDDLLDLANGERLRQTDASCRKSHDILDHCLEQHPREHLAWNILGLTRWNEKDFEGAERAFRKAMALNPNDRCYRANLGYVLLDMGKVDEAVRVLRAAHAKWPDYPYAGEVCARALEAQGDHSGAYEIRKAVIAAVGTNVSRIEKTQLSWLVRIYEGIGERSKADEILKKRNPSATATAETVAQPYREALLAGPDSPRQSVKVA